MPPTSWLEINLSRLDANLACFRAVLAAGAPGVAGAPGAPGAPGAVPEPAASELVTAGAIPVRRGSAAGTPATATAGAPAPRTRPRICGVVKADAYGLGVAAVAQRLANRGVDMLAVFSPAQAEQLATLTLPCPILVLMRMAELGRGDPLYRHASTGRLHLSIHDRGQLLELEQRGRMLGVNLPVHLYMDTGMSRAGLTLEELPRVLGELRGLRHVQLAGIYTHLASSESDGAFTDVQAGRLDHLLETHRALLPPARELTIHLANTCGALRDRRLHRDMIRVGLGLYGYGPEQLKAPAPLLVPGQRLQPTVRWLSRVVHVQRYAKGAPVGYGSTLRLERDSVLGVVPVGYADGYPLALSGVASVGVAGHGGQGTGAAGLAGPTGNTNPTAAGAARAARVLGRVNMDQIVVDLTDVPPGAPGAGGPAGPGALVELISDDPASAWGLASLAVLARSSCYEMLCRLSTRVPRRYVVDAG